ncbi:sulfatase-like hydrolase/transferase [Ramlibacter sp. AW1]|uniref:Sulfatase-like hydrolase/transferase n=1 Tax=Ramlibacter aurantiacus TaxID=2801330 RepID=A0A937D4P1_9BURK|nr:sulfatase-like hydrolase/transferase [Ramlibacter aurantiacus]MBL0419093.1 sulfatase-like hydrolase/transferase [Ramlibacter aurantiacus]
MRPNFLVFIVDQLNASHLGCWGNRQIATPHIDALAARGWSAAECHVASPICMPNRASIMTGRMPSAHGVRHNGIPLSLASRTFVELLHEAGYETSLCGKSHLQNITDKKPAPHPGRPVYGKDAQRPYPGDHRQESIARWREDPAFEPALPYYGFGHLDLAIEHGDCPQGHYRRWLAREHPQALELAGPAKAIPTPEYRLSQVRQAWRTRVPEELHPTAWIADRAIERLQGAAARERPFFVYCSFPDPHHPYTPPGRYWDLYRPEDVELPASFHSSEPPPHLAWLRGERDAGRAVKDSQACFAATERETREAIALNWGSLSFIDAQVGRVLEALEASGQAGNTVVVFTSDHGEFAGEHQLLLKGSLHYPSLTRTPLIWRDPAAAEGGRRSDALLSSIDISASIFERVGLEPYNGLQGRSFLPLVRQEPGHASREHLLIEEEGQRTYFGFDGPVRMRTLLSPTHRLSVYDGAEWGELYDRRADPTESRNLWNDPAQRALRGELLGELARQMLAHADTSPAPTAFA